MPEIKTIFVHGDWRYAIAENGWQYGRFGTEAEAMVAGKKHLENLPAIKENTRIANEENDMKNVIILKSSLLKAGFFGLFLCQVCADGKLTDAEICEEAEKENLSGTQCGWRVVRSRDDIGLDETEDFNLAPCKCAEHEGRMHYILHC